MNRTPTRLIYTITLICSLLLNRSISQQVFINEVQSSNSRTVVDEDGDSPDWVELYNASDEDILFRGYWISDDPMEKLKWQIPEFLLKSKNYVLIFASDKNKFAFWDALVNWGDIWKYRVATSQPSANWNTLNYNDTQWFSGPSGFGYGDGDDETIINQTISLYARIVFSINELDRVEEAHLHIDYDDAFVAYLNGIEIARSNIGDLGFIPAFNATADEYREATIYQGGSPELYVIENARTILQQGDNVLAIQVHNYEIESSDLTLIPFFTVRLNSMSDFLTPPHSILHTPSISMHTNFKIQSTGEPLLLCDFNGDIIDSLNTGEIPPDVSKGRFPDGESTWMLFPDPTPGSSNITPGYQSILLTNEPDFTPIGGFYSGTTTLTLTADSSANIYYTRDGSEPDESSYRYSNPIKVSEPTVIRAKSFHPSLFPSQIATHTYFINEEKTLPVISLSTDPVHLWDSRLGIYSNNTSRWEWEKPVHVEFFEDNGELGFSIDAGMEIYGWGGSFFDQKSLAIYARGKYGYPELNYQLFPNLDVNVFEAFILRNSGNDWWSTLFRDAMITSLMKGTEVDFQAYRPSVVYLNGEYWGIHNIREKINEHFIASHHDIDPDNIDFLEYKEMPEPLIHHGDALHYNTMYEFISDNNLEDEDNYEVVKSMMDINNFIDYQIGEIFCANLDWPANNSKYWRPRTPEGKWRWIMYDTDTGFSLWDDIWDDSPSKGWGLDFIAHATEDEQSWGYPEDWPNAPWSTQILRGLLENKAFKNEFINRFADYLNTRFHPDSLKDKIEVFETRIESEIPYHVDRWDRDVENWDNEVKKVKTFASHRASYVRNHIVSNFGLKGLSGVTTTVTPEKGGKIQVNSIVVGPYPWKGVYFKGIPIQVTAIPEPGYRFVGWLGSRPSGNRTITLTPRKSLSIQAVFQQDSDYIVPEKYTLSQNYPNPFNTNTVIEFSIPEANRVILKIYDLQGREAITLINEDRPPGIHRVMVDQRGLSSGIYFYFLKAGHFTQSRKMIYIK